MFFYSKAEMDSRAYVEVQIWVYAKFFKIKIKWNA